MHECKELPSRGNRARPARPQESRDRWSRADSCHTGSVNGMGCAGEAWKQRRSLSKSRPLSFSIPSAVAPTKDLFGWGGAVKLANADAEQLVKDYAVIEALCHSGLWTIE